MKNNEYPKILIISHNLYDVNNNIGKTLVSLLNGWPKENIAQIYLRNEMPSFDWSNQYYCITDKDILKSVCSLHINSAGKRIEIQDKGSNDISTAESKMYQIGNRRKPIISLTRDMMWHVGKWKTEGLKKWVTEVVKPDVILFVPNDYCLVYEIALYVQKLCQKNIVPYYMDDTFYYNQKSTIIDQIRRKQLRRLAKQIHCKSNIILTICDYMSNEYTKIFNKPCYDFKNSVFFECENKDVYLKDKPTIIVTYTGNLHSHRWQSIIEIGNAIDKIVEEKKQSVEFDIFTATVLESNVKKQFEMIKSIHFKGLLRPDEVEKVQRDSDILIHVEAFDKASMNSTRLSISTKIPEYLHSHTCIFAYGPSEIASIRYLQDNNIAQVCINKDDIQKMLDVIISNSEIRNEMANRGYSFGKEQHDIRTVSANFQKRLMIEGTK